MIITYVVIGGFTFYYIVYKPVRFYLERNKNSKDKTSSFKISNN